jgi:hypothetical protein
MSTEPVVWSQPLPRGPWRTALIELCVSMCEDGSGDYLTAHWLFARKVLREDERTAFAIAARFRGTPITSVGEFECLADEWWEPTG